jgi:bifunctional N-acetylglucosamine-1-phosphate-uridyltransferase/glucosamine-1-phosphate-acetyltransferase GlmU-like protein
MKIIIPMSGIGKRFVEAGYKDPKPLIIVEGKPIIEHIVNLFDKENDEFVFICNDQHLKETNMYNELLRICPNSRIYEVSVNNRKGPVDAVMQIADEEINDDDQDIIISYCDYGTVWDYDAFKKDINERELDGSIPSYIGFHPHMLGSDNYAFIKEDIEESKVFSAIQEKKPFTDNKMNEYASNGTYYYRNGAIVKKYFKELIDKNISTNGEFYCSMVYNLMKEDGLKIGIFEIKKMLQWGTPKDLEEYLLWSNYFLYRKPDFNKTFVDKYETTLILPMAGAGSRFSKEGFLTPKPLLDVEGLPMIIQAVECLPKTSNKIFIGQEEHFKKYEIDKTITDFYPEAKIIGINYITDGQACTCEIAFKNYDIPMEKPVLISACDNGVYYDIDKYNELLEDPDVDIIIWSFSNNPTSKLYPHMYAWLHVDENNYIQDVSIKKAFTEHPNKYCIIGTMLFKKGQYFIEGLNDIYENNNRTNGEFYVDNMIMPLIKMGYKVKIFDVDNYLCWGTPNDYKTYNYWKEYFVCI